MHSPTPIDELLEVRAMIALLKEKEARLALIVELEVAVPGQRPGWPIARHGGAAGHRGV